MLNKIILFTILHGLIFSTSWADIHDDIEAITFGPEFTIGLSSGEPMDKASVKTNKYKEYIDALKRHLIYNQSGSAQFTTELLDGRTRFLSPNGWNFLPITDRGVLEILMSPMTVADSEKFADDIQDAIFATAANVDLYPSLFMGGGHINIGIQILKKHPLLLRNFIMDSLNNSFLFSGIMNYDVHNAVPMNLVGHQYVQKYLEKIRDFDDNHFRRPEELLKDLWAVTSQTYDPFPHSGYRNKEIAFSFHNTHSRVKEEHKRIEIRAVRPQASFYVWIAQIRLLKNRLHYLSQFNEPIAFNPRLPFINYQNETEISDDEIYNPPYPAQIALRAFYNYVTESGEVWEAHRNYVWPKWVKDYETGESELEKFESSEWFREQQKNRGCKEFLKS